MDNSGGEKQVNVYSMSKGNFRSLRKKAFYHGKLLYEGKVTK